MAFGTQEFDLAILIVNGRDGHHNGVPWIELCLERIIANTSRLTRYRIFVWNHDMENSRVAKCLGSDDRIEELSEKNFDLGSYAGPTYDGVWGRSFHGYHPHRSPLQILYQYARRKYQFHAVFTFDSDSWPIRPLWDVRILTSLRDEIKLVGVWRDELWPSVTPFVHPSGLGVRNATISELALRFDRKPVAFEEDTLSHFTREVEGRFGRRAVDRLRRTNRDNRHGVFGGVYEDWIYHHHLGTRLKQKAVTKGWEERGECAEANRQVLDVLADEVFADPQRYMLNLRYGDRAKELAPLASELRDHRSSVRRDAIAARARSVLDRDPVKARYILDLVPPESTLDTQVLALSAETADRLGRAREAATYRYALRALSRSGCDAGLDPASEWAIPMSRG